MKVKVGDTIKFLNDIGGGKVTKILDKETALVLNDTGFEIPVLIEELMPDISVEEYSEKQKVNIPPEIKNVYEEEPLYTDNTDVNIYLAYVPENQKRIGDSDCDVYLINDSNFFIYYNFAEKNGTQYESITGKIEPNVKEKISTVEINSIPDNVITTVQILFFSKEKYSLKEPLNSEIKIRATKFFKKNAFKENDFFDEFAIIVPVIEENAMQEALNKLKKEEIQKVIEQKANNKRINRPRLYQKQEPKNIKEVDLHITELIDDETGMSDHDKLQLQLDTFHNEIKTAIKERYKKIVFIHGVGSGSLKLKIRSELQHKYKQYQFQDASFKEYGYGATMILLRR